jgi:hypothetical protein
MYVVNAENPRTALAGDKAVETFEDIRTKLAEHRKQ